MPIKFTYRYDLTSATLSPDAAFGSEAESTALSPGSVTPEPSSLLLMSGAGIGILGYGFCQRKRNNTTRKEQ